ncbi:MAG: hypothetical protein V3V99_11515 [candidate division Zixibacteria bacterium]
MRQERIIENNYLKGDIMRWGIYVLSVLILLSTIHTNISARSEFQQVPKTGELKILESKSYSSGTDDLRFYIVHNAGLVNLPFGSDGIFGYSLNIFDPETGEDSKPCEYPKSSGLYHIFSGVLWVGGLVGEDTLVSMGTDGWAIGAHEFGPDNPVGGAYRSGNFADDEFVTTFSDAILDSENPLNIEVVRTSYSWADTLYDDFIILKYEIRNIGSQEIYDGWSGFYFDGDIYHESNIYMGYADDITGALNIDLYDGDPSSSTIIPYIIDNDGDPTANSWDTASIRSAISMRVLDSDVENLEVNYNWWISNSSPYLDYGPRQLEVPFRLFDSDNVGTPVTDGDRYYILSHPEVDFNQVQSANLTEYNGWLMPTRIEQARDFADGYDTRFLYSFGPFDLLPGESTTFWLALAAAGGIHSDPDGFVNTFDPYNPEAFVAQLDFSDLIKHHQRADSVYNSGLLLPHPGPPVGLELVTYSQGEVSIAWSASERSDIAGYNVHYTDSLIDDQWHKVNDDLILPSNYSFTVPDPNHYYVLSVTLVDNLDRESEKSISVSTGPTTVTGFNAESEGATVLLSWDNHPDPNVEKYLIYRQVTEFGEPADNFIVFDSTTSNFYNDFDVTSGMAYHCKVTAKDISGLESVPTDLITVYPSSKHKDLLLFNMNYDNGFNIVYKLEYVDEIYDSLAVGFDIERVDYQDSLLTFKTMADYSTIIFLGGSRYSSLNEFVDHLRTGLEAYLSSGGNAILSLLTLADGVKTNFPYYGFEPEYLGIDSCVTNLNVMAVDGALPGDLLQCKSMIPTHYPDLIPDQNKLDDALFPIDGYIPMSGFVYANDKATGLYKYQSSVPDTINHNQLNGYRVMNDTYKLIVFNFPLFVMEIGNGFLSLKAALEDINGVLSYNCGDANNDGDFNIGDAVKIINHVFRGGSAPDPILAGDANCDEDCNVGDAVYIINTIFKFGPDPCAACP